jgi:hypothetical protein
MYAHLNAAIVRELTAVRLARGTQNPPRVDRGGKAAAFRERGAPVVRRRYPVSPNSTRISSLTRSTRPASMRPTESR